MDELARLIRGEMIGGNACEGLFERVLCGELDPVQIGAVLALLQARGINPAELAGAARAMRRHIEPVPYAPAASDRLVDTCGTGGAPKTFNVSTAAALVAAASHPDVRIAKHGNRSRTGRGSAEVLAALGIDLEAPPETLASCLRQAHLCFCFAIHHHPAMRHAAGPRKSLGVPTAFNLLGPLTNPARARRQLIGVYAPELVDLVAGALAELDTERAVVVHSREGLDEIGIGSPTDAAIVEGAKIERIVIDPGALGFAPVPHTALVASDVDDSAAIIRRVLGGEQGGFRDMTLINAAATLWVAGLAEDMRSGTELAASALDRGDAAKNLEVLAACSRARPG